MKKTKRFVVTSAIVASLALGTATTVTTAQTSQASALDDFITTLLGGSSSSSSSDLSSLLSGLTGSTGTGSTNSDLSSLLSELTGSTSTGSTTAGVDASKITTIALTAGTEPTEENIEEAIGGSPTFYGIIPAKISISGNTVTFTPDLSSIPVIGNAISGLLKPTTATITYSTSLTFKNGTTTTNVRKGDKGFDLTKASNYNITGNDADDMTVEQVGTSDFNYAYPGTYTATVKVDTNDSGITSEDTDVTINVLDADFNNLDQTVLKGEDVDTDYATGTDSLGQSLDMTLETNVDTSKTGSHKVTYLATDPSLDYNNKPITWEATGTIKVVDSDSDLNVDFQDADTGDIIDSTQFSGADGQTKSVTPPDGYDLVNSSDSTVTLAAGSHSKTIQVIKSGSTVSTPFSGTVSTYATNGIVPLYTSDGTQTARSLAPNSDWATDSTKTINGDTYYRVSTNEWVKASSVYEYTPVSSTITTNSNSVKPLYSIDGSKSSRSLAPNTSWYTDRTATINGTSYYRVSTDEWIATSDVH
ncbi:SLAP domain-containing protein [Companilactobacillus versmoldensis]|uniref:S-layer protein C-terminal domain-containing protein n=1 Tax=Companilactobacillus versmoldensis DSM 14857 = KCTC 3814 TaxID=1423815 RepID=A0A0R1SDZ9_9LACO|nr:SLAP domain-containing protein [Companilactobacillus versmoldensis]KRL67455.1 hypothetical protein FC27_GL001771 [Companilactobacillus versmoldensis DSM 14857 = KCTC 3814]